MREDLEVERVAPQETTEGDDRVGVPGADELARDRRNLERTGTAIDRDLIAGRTMPRQCVERPREQPLHDLVIEAAGDDRKPQT